MDADHHRVRFLRVVLANAENGLAILATDGVGDVPVELDLAAVDFHLCCAADEFRNLDFSRRALEKLAPELGCDVLDDRRFHGTRLA